ncbi:MAG: hypothetical protein JO372_03945 [Solirubrobacterales bacterium]|nr:hypothetical protein [Solirubrobacterales bacterium]
MFRFKLRAALVSLTAIAALAVPASALATNVTRWEIYQPNEFPTVYNLYAPYANVPSVLTDHYRPNPYDPEPISYGHETFGVNLTWGRPNYEYTNALQPYVQWEFIRQPRHYLTQQIAASNHVALYNTVNHRYLAWACGGLESACLGAPIESFGINLYWSRNPQYQWQVAKGGDDGHADLADLYNDIEKAYLIDHHQTFGVDLGWIHAPFETGPDYIPPAPPVSTRPVSLPSRPPIK